MIRFPEGYDIVSGTQTQEKIDINQIFAIHDLFPSYRDLLETRQLDKSHIEALANTEESVLPAIKVVKINARGKVRCYIVDGYHRYAAACKRGDTHIRILSDLYETPESVLTDFFECNLKHGLTTNKATRSAYAVTLHKLYPDMGVSDIARAVKLNKSSVSRALKSYERKSELTEESTNSSDVRKIVSTITRLINLLSDYDGNSDTEKVENFIADVFETYGKNIKELQKVGKEFEIFLDASEIMRESIEARAI